jgi:error-prone DNA polymerase
MLCDADTIGVFQIESRAQMSMLPRLRPTKFYDLVIEVAIVRPGPIQGDMVHPYLRRRNGEEVVSYPSEALKSVLEKTLGVPLFQEQAMRVAMVGAGFSAEEADKLRRSMAAWRRSGEMSSFHEKIVAGMKRNGYTAEYAEQCFNMLKGFGEYGFPESHSASFALLVYVSAWIKRHHPAVFCCALLNSQPMGFYAPAQIVRDAQAHGVSVGVVDVNLSDWDCTLEPPAPMEFLDVTPKRDWGRGGPSVRLGFRMIRGFSKTHAERIIAARPFHSVEHLAQTTRLPAHVMRRLAEADAFSSLSLSRRPALWEAMKCDGSVPPLLDSSEAEEPAVTLPAMPISHEVAADYQTAGLSLKRHPLSLIREQLRELKIITAAELGETPHGRRVRVAGLVLIRQRPGTASGIVFATLEDETGVANLIIRPEVYDRYRPAARHATLLQAEGHVQRQGQVIHVMTQRMSDLSELLLEHPVKSRDFH